MTKTGAPSHPVYTSSHSFSNTYKGDMQALRSGPVLNPIRKTKKGTEK